MILMGSILGCLSLVGLGANVVSRRYGTLSLEESNSACYLPNVIVSYRPLADYK